MATKKFSELKVGDKFLIKDELYKKASALTYVSLDNPILGEFTPSSSLVVTVPEVVGVKSAKKRIKK